MTAAVLSEFLRRLGRGMAAETLAEHTDPELIRKALDEGAEISLQAIVNRHGPMVYRVCWRVLQHAQDTEDAFQATFLILAQKLRSVRKQASLASWLHGVARRVALKARAQSAVRRRRERQLDKLSATPADELTWNEIRSALDDELARLPEKWRQPLILCYLEGRTQDESASLLGWSKSTVRRRLEEARTALSERLQKRGVLLPAALSAVLLSECQSSAALAPSLMASVASSAANVALGNSVIALSPRVAALVKGFRAHMLAINMKTAGAFLLLLGLGVAGISGAGLARRESAAATEPPPIPALLTMADAPMPPQSKTVPPGTESKNEAQKELRVVVLDPDGKPLKDAKVHAGIWTKEKPFKSNRDYQTDAAGVAVVELPKTYYILRLWAQKKPFVAMFSHWEQNELNSGIKPPAEYTMRLETASTAGGRIIDEQGKPIAGAEVQIRADSNIKPAGSDGRTDYNTWLSGGTDALLTDAKGRWRIEDVPNHPEIDLTLLITHPDFVSDPIWGQMQKRAGITRAMLRDETATITLKRGAMVRGQVTDPLGKPIRDAIVIVGRRPYFSSVPVKFATDADGRFRLPALPPQKESFTVMAPGWAPQMRDVDLKLDMPAQDFRMQPGKPIRLRFVDTSGKPIPGVSVSLVSWNESQAIESMNNPNHPKMPDTGIPKASDENGIWEWKSAPSGELKLHAYRSEFGIADVEMAGGASEQTVLLRPEHRLIGRVTDAVTGKPIPEFTVVPVNLYRKDWSGAERGHSIKGNQGRLDFKVDHFDYARRLRIEAPGYRSQVGPEFRAGDESSRTQDFRLEPSLPMTGLVVDANGNPVDHATVCIATPTEIIELDSDLQNRTVTTDAAGRFSFSDPGEQVTLIAEAKAGFAMADFSAGQHDLGTLRLRPWATIEGQFKEDGKAVTGATVLVDFIRIHSLERPKIQTSTLQTTTDAEGRFRFPRVPPIPVAVRVYLGPWQDEGFRSGPHVPLDLSSGQAANLQLGSDGAAVSGKVKLTGKIPAGLDCAFSLNYLVRKGHGVKLPEELAKLGFDASKGWSDACAQSPEGQAFFSSLPNWFVKLAPDGAFRISGVPAGDYSFSIKIYAKPSGCLVDPLAQMVVPVTVTAADVERGQLSLPSISVPVEPVPVVGDAPELNFTRLDGSAATLAQCKGKFTVIHFWASWCGACKHELPELKTVHDRFAPRGLNFLGVTLDTDVAAWQGALKRIDLPWPQARLAAASSAGVSSVPTYWLLDPKGKLVAKVYDTEELSKALADHVK